MSNLAALVESIAAAAAVMCTQCLIDAVAEESDELGGKAGHLMFASANRRTLPGGKAEYDQAFADVIKSVLVIAVFTAELSTSRDVAWRDTDPSPVTVEISLN